MLALHLGRRKDAGTLRPDQVSLGKLNNVREALDICRTARTILCANGVSLEYPNIRHTNNLESVLTYEGTVEMHTLVVGQAMSGHAAFRLQRRCSPPPGKSQEMFRHDTVPAAEAWGSRGSGFKASS